MRRVNLSVTFLTESGMSINPCWPSDIAAGDPGFTLLLFDSWYNGKASPLRLNESLREGLKLIVVFPFHRLAVIVAPCFCCRSFRAMGSTFYTC
ncbi:hypothetical protein F5B18DRAFT_170881 [Nemania serpens]|nr:hypothetical protein F5B18DRAFT_170881 [Nemania serpens]